MSVRAPKGLLKTLMLRGKAGWRGLPAIARLGVGVGGGLLSGGALLATALSVPEMLGEGRDILEDVGLDPTGRRARARKFYQNELNGELTQPDYDKAEMRYQRQVQSTLDDSESFQNQASLDLGPRWRALQDQALLRQLGITHEEEMANLQRKMVAQNDTETILRRMMGG